jgi:transposase
LHRETNSIIPKRHAGGCPFLLDEVAMKILYNQVMAHPSATLSELQFYLEKQTKLRVHPSTIHRALQRPDLSVKKKPDKL